MKKFLATEQFISYLQNPHLTDPASFESALATMDAVKPNGEPSDWLRYGATEGFFDTLRIDRDNVPAVFLWFQITENKSFFIVGAASLNGVADQADLIDTASRKFARLNNCLTVEFRTRRKGAVEKALQAGYGVDSIVLKLIL